MRTTGLPTERLRQVFQEDAVDEWLAICLAIEDERRRMFGKPRRDYLRLVSATERPTVSRRGAFVKMPLRCVK